MAKGVNDQSRFEEAFRYLGEQQKLGKVYFFTANPQGEAQAERLRAQAGWDKWRLPGYSAWIVSAPGIMGTAYGREDSTGGAGGGGSVGSGGGAPSAVQAGSGVMGSGGPRITTAAANVSAFVPERSDNFFGLDAFNSPDKIGPDYSPEFLNWDSFRRFGSRCNRAGTAKMADDIDTVTYTAASVVDVLPNSSLTASTDYVIFTKPDTDTHAFWFDTTGSDTEPAGSQAADDSTEITTTGMSGASVAAALAQAINTADIGLVANASGTTLILVAVVGGSTWSLEEFVTNAGFTVSNFSDQLLGSQVPDPDYEGLSITRIPGPGNGPDQLILAFSDGDIGDTPSLYPTSLHVVTTAPVWGFPMPIINCPGPNLALAQIAGPKVRATLSHGWPGTGRRNNTVRQIVVRYSLRAFPADVDGRDGLDSIPFASANRAAWTGTGVTKDTTANLTAGQTIFVSAWTITLEGVSKRSVKRITIT